VERVKIEDKTALSSRNATEVTVDGKEVETATKTGRKRYMVGGAVHVGWRPRSARNARGYGFNPCT
jgi:hypothetical protein